MNRRRRPFFFYGEETFRYKVIVGTEEKHAPAAASATDYGFTEMLDVRVPYLEPSGTEIESERA